MATVDLVDDDPSVLRALSRMLRAYGLQVRTFSSGAEFLSALDGSALPDCVVLDMQMPGMTGLDVQAKLNALGLGLPIIFITAHEDRQTKEAALGNGAAAFFYKPVSAEVLCGTISTIVKPRRSSPPPQDPE
jgi:FixJ family two-component response regulator